MSSAKKPFKKSKSTVPSIRNDRKTIKNKKSSRRRTCAASCSLDKLRYLFYCLLCTAPRCGCRCCGNAAMTYGRERRGVSQKTIRRIVFGWKRGESGEKHRTRLCRSDCVCPSRACRLFRHAQAGLYARFFYLQQFFSFLDRLKHPNVFQFHWISGQRILVQYDQISELIGSNRAFLLFFKIF